MTKTGAYQSVQDKVEQDQQENQASILQIKKWTNTHQLIKLNSIWWKGKSGQLVVARDNNLKRGVINFYHNSPPGDTWEFQTHLNWQNGISGGQT
jgi:hypothetical protein